MPNGTLAFTTRCSLIIPSFTLHSKEPTYKKFGTTFVTRMIPVLANVRKFPLADINNKLPILRWEPY